jgi:hypothetical protein
MTTSPTDRPTRLDAPSLRALLERPGGPPVLDVRSPAEFESAHIPGAYNVPLDTLSGLEWVAAAVGGGLTVAALTDACAMGMLLSRLPYNRGAGCDIDSVVAQLAGAEEPGR